MQTAVRLVTYQEFQQMPEPHGYYLELHNGEVVRMTNPAFGHTAIQLRLQDLLRSRLKAFGRVGTEFPFRALPEYEGRRADVAYVPKARYGATPLGDCLPGAPDLTVEVVSPSNTRREIAAKKELCLTNGAIEFWTVRGHGRTVEVARADGSTATYRDGDSIPMTAFSVADLPVSAIFDVFSDDEA